MRSDSTNDTPPALSIVLSTCRLGGLDITWDMCARQTERDFELILVDYFYYERREIVADRAAETGLPPERFLHIPPRNGCWEATASAGEAYNTGLALARGDLVCMLGDYQHQYDDFVKDHLGCFREWGGKITLAGDFGAFSYAGESFDRERPADHLFSVFSPEFTYDASRVTNRIYYAHRGPHVDEHGFLPGESFNATQNESIPREALYKINGMDEIYDGRRGFQDQDIGFRLIQAGYRQRYLPDLTEAVHLWTHDKRAVPDGASTWGGAIWQPSGMRNANLLEMRKLFGFPPAAFNGGFFLRKPVSVHDILEMAAARRPKHARPFCQIPEPGWEHRFSSEPPAGSPTLLTSSYLEKTPQK